MSRPNRPERIAKPQEPAYQLVTLELPPIRNPISYPADWARGQPLNVRNYGTEHGPDWRVTLLEEAPDAERPWRTLHFNDALEVQTFVSFWYAGAQQVYR